MSIYLATEVCSDIESISGNICSDNDSLGKINQSIDYIKRYLRCEAVSTDTSYVSVLYDGYFALNVIF